jgi:magnesium transporter
MISCYTDQKHMQKNELWWDLLEDVEMNFVKHKTTNIYSDILTGTMDAASVISNNMNTIIKQMTSISIMNDSYCDR